MTSYLARVRNGRLILDVATELPEGTEVELVATDPDELRDLDEQQRRQLVEDVREGDEDAAAGRIEDAEVFLRRLRKP
jgi:hypothetical protein